MQCPLAVKWTPRKCPLTKRGRNQIQPQHGADRTLTLGITRYGEYTGAPVSVVQEFSPKNVVDFSVRNNFTERLSAPIGVLNVGNVYPDKLSDANAQSLGLLYGEESPFGVNGRAYYLKCTVRM